MKKLILVIAFVLFSFGSTAQAALIDNGDGTVTQTRSDGSQLMWMQDANLAATNTFGVSGISGGTMDWNTLTGAGGWLEAMNASNYLGYSDWRLPETLPINGINYEYNNNRYDGSNDFGFNVTSLNSEMSYLYYVELGNKGWYDTSGNGPQTG